MGKFLQRGMALAGIFNFLMPASMVASADCDYYQELSVGNPYYIYNEGYPNYYTGQNSCRWQAISPIGSRIVLSCEDIDLPKSSSCYGDRLAISLSGNVNFNDAHNYCGKGSISLISERNSLAVGLFTMSNTNGGRFICTITAIQDGGTTSTTTETPSSCDCGWKQGTRIVGGQETGVNEYPAMAAMIDLQIRSQYCGAVILSTKYGLTAAHCVFERNPNDVALLVGDHDLSTGSDTNQARLHRISSIQMHPAYDSTTNLNDLAIVQTSDNIVFNLYVGPICLPFRYTEDQFTNQTVTALGWGQTEFSGPKSSVLLGVDLNVISNTDCATLQSDPVNDGILCTYKSGKDTCLSDSGGPLLWYDKIARRLQLVAIISHGLGCATARPALNTRVTNYLSWILLNTRDATYCIK